ncbi:Hypothetical predicted protein [Cloeon dipterum]|uniref:Uncharacterized protein n=1 Tax=Cloeon dipterum TaxID=197152 RepID=A0A8S1DRK3_9INSE|nr:Hypothetical predicted protein [Cloeon dipterum]
MATALLRVCVLLAAFGVRIHADNGGINHNQVAAYLDIDTQMREVYEAAEVIKDKEVIILLGNTGTGKSTLSKFIRLDPTLKVEKVLLAGSKTRKTSLSKQDVLYRLIFSDGEVKIGSNSSHESKTLVPNVDVDLDTGIHIVDCAGFQDTRGPRVDLSVAYFNKMALDYSHKVKILIVENYANLKQHGNRDSFTRALKHTAHLIGENLDVLEGSVGLVATKVPRTESAELVYSEIEAFLSATLEYFIRERKTQSQIRLLQYLTPEHQELFWTPENEHQLDSDNRNRHELRDWMFNWLNFSKPFTHKLQITVDAETRIFVRDTFLAEAESAIQKIIQKELRESLAQNFDVASSVNLRPLKRMTRKVLGFCSDYLYSLRNLDTLDQLLSFASRNHESAESLLFNIQMQMRTVIFLHQVIGKDSSEFERRTISDLKMYLEAPATEEYNFISFLEKMIDDFDMYKFQMTGSSILIKKMASLTLEKFPDFTANLIGWGFRHETYYSALSLSPTTKKIKWFNKLASEFEKDQLKETKKNGTVIFSDRIIVLSKVKEWIETRSADNNGEFVVMAYEKLYIDCNLTIQDCNLKFVSPVVHVTKENVVLHLIGEHGKDKDKAKSCPAEKGEHGADGYSSGDFAIVALEVENDGWLSVISQGGNGGKGQDGGDGCNTTYDNWIAEGRSYQLKCKNFHNLLCKKEYIAPPTNGGDGGKGGHGTLPGDIAIIVQNQTINLKTLSISGKHGEFGKGGSADKLGYKCPCRMYSINVKNGKFILKDAMNKQCCKTTLPATNGRDGEQDLDTTLQSKQKFEDTRLLSTMLDFYGVASGKISQFGTDSKAYRLLAFFFTSDSFISNGKPADYLEAIEKGKTHIEHQNMQETIRSQITFCTFILESVQKWNAIHKGNGSIDLELRIIAYLDVLRTFRHGKQVVRLAELVDSQLNRLKNVDIALKEITKFEAISEEKKSMQRTIDEAEQVITNLRMRNMEGLKQRLMEEFNDLLEKSKESQYETKMALNEHQKYRKSVVLSMWKNVGVGVIKMVSDIAGTFAPPVKIIGNKLAGVVDEMLPEPKDQQLTVHFEGIKQVNNMLIGIENQNKEQFENVIDLAKKINELDAEERFLKEESRKFIQNVSHYNANQTAKIDLRAMMKSVHFDIVSVMNNIQNSSSTNKNKNAKTHKYKSIYDNAMKAKYYVEGVGSDVMSIYERFSKDKDKLGQVCDAIDQNLENLQELGKFETLLQETFKPLLQKIVQTFNLSLSAMNKQNSFQILMQKIDMKTYAQSCISIIQRITQALYVEDERFTVIITDLQDLLSTLIDAYDQIEQLRLRLHLYEFMGKLSGVQCETDECSSNMKLSQDIQLQQLVREFGLVYAAFQQVSFPFGAERTKKLNINVLALLSSPKEKVVELLRTELEKIRDVLKAEKTMTDKKDVDVIKSEFSSKSKSTSPFFTWRNAQHATMIEKLLQGEQITLDAFIHYGDDNNAVKANWVTLEITSEDKRVVKNLTQLLDNFHLEMVRGKRSYFRCGTSIYAVSSEELNLTMSFETNQHGKPLAMNAAVEKVFEGDVPLSPYSLWRFRLVHRSKEDPKVLFSKLVELAPRVDLHLVGKGSYVNEGAEVCNSPLSETYEFVEI